MEKLSEHIPDDINFTLGYLEGRQSKKRWLYSNDTPTSKWQEKEEEVDSTYQSLKEKRHDKYENPKLCQWARMVAGGLHNSLGEPPDVPAF